MLSSAFDDFIDDCLLDGKEILRTKQYKERTNLIASKLLFEMIEQEKINLRAA